MDRRVSRGMLPFLAIHAMNEFYRSERKPPVTAGLLITNTLIYLRPGVLDRLLPTLSEVWFNPHLILKYFDLKRFFLSPFYHLGEAHLVYNMMSLVWKGIQLETALGSIEYASMVATLLGLSQGVTILLAKSLLIFGYDRAYYYENAVGFSGVLFAMKVVLNWDADNYTSVYGLLVPTRYAAWAELILIQMFTPGVSFLGHLGGILGGMLYMWLFRSSSSTSNPLTTIFRGVTGLLRWPTNLARNLLGFRRQRIYGRGTVGGSRGSGNWHCPACTFENSEWLEACEMCDTERNDNEVYIHHPYDNGVYINRPANAASNPSLEELRRRRVERFNR